MVQVENDDFRKENENLQKGIHNILFRFETELEKVTILKDECRQNLNKNSDVSIINYLKQLLQDSIEKNKILEDTIRKLKREIVIYKTNEDKERI